MFQLIETTSPKNMLILEKNTHTHTKQEDGCKMEPVVISKDK